VSNREIFMFIFNQFRFVFRDFSHLVYVDFDWFLTPHTYHKPKAIVSSFSLSPTVIKFYFFTGYN